MTPLSLSISLSDRVFSLAMTAILNGHLVTVLTVSGSVVLLSLTKDMLFLLKNYVFDAEQRLQTALSSRSSPLFDALHHLREEGNACERLPFSESASPEPSSALRSVHKDGAYEETAEANGEKSYVVKRVRFAADVVEPAGNGKEYRKRIMSRTNDQQEEGSWQHIQERRHLTRHGGEEDVPCVPANRVALYKALRHSQRQRDLYCS